MRVDTRYALLIFFFFTVVYLLLQGAKAGYTVDANATFRITASLVEEGDLFPQVRSKQGIFQALAYVPFYLLGDAIAARYPDANPDDIRRRALCWMNGLLSAVTCAVLYLLCREMGAGLVASRNVALAAGLSTMMLPYARYDYNKVPSELLISLLLLAVYRLCRRGSKTDFLYFGLWIGLLAGIRLELLAVVPGLAVLIWFRRRSSWTRAVVLPGTILAGTLVGMVLWYQWSRWGGVSGYEVAFNRSPLVGLYGFFFSLGKSLFLYNPIFILLPAALWCFRRSDWLPTWVLVVGPPMLLYSWWSNWWGGWAWGPRHLLPIVPILAAPLAVSLTHWRSGVWTCLFWHLTALGIFVQLLGIALDFNDGILTLFRQGRTEPMLIYLWPFGGIANHARLVFRWPLDLGLLHYFFYDPIRAVGLTIGCISLAILCLLKLRVSREEILT